MNKAELLEILKNGESSTIEFKTEDVHAVSLTEEIVAFTNMGGGKILIGVDDSGQIKGCERQDLEEFLVNVCRKNIKPSLIPMIEKVGIDGKWIYILSIPVGDTPHATSRGIYYIRLGSTKQIPTQQELLRLFQKKNILQLDETPVLKAGIQSIDLGKVNRYLARLGQGGMDIEDDLLIVNDLVNLSVLIEIEKEHYPTLAGLLAFGKNPQKYFPSYTITCGAYRGRDFLSDTIREKSLSGSLDEIIEDAISFLKFCIHQDHSLEENLRRKDEYQYPIEALREGIVNAVCHRDYTITGSAIRIFFFEDRIEIRSPGGLPNTLTLESMIFRQFTRNQAIASFLSGYGYMEKRGKGILRMIRLCEEKQIICERMLTPDKSEFVVTFRQKTAEICFPL